MADQPGGGSATGPVRSARSTVRPTTQPIDVVDAAAPPLHHPNIHTSRGGGKGRRAERQRRPRGDCGPVR